MPRFWWVNHKQTFRQEIDGTYLWSPKRNANGARNIFYENMRAAAPGDLVLSFADGLIRHVGRVADFAFTAPKPEEAVRSFSAPMLCTNFPRNSARLSPRPDCLTPTKNLFLEQAAVIAVVPVVLVAIICTRKDELGQRKQLFHCRLLLH